MFVIVTVIVVGGSILIPWLLNVTRRVFSRSDTVTGSIKDKYLDRHGKRLPDDHISYTDFESPTGYWFVIGNTHLLVNQWTFDRFKEDDVVTVKVIGKRAVSVSAGADQNAKQIETYEAEIEVERAARSWEQQAGLRAWSASVDKFVAIVMEEKQVDVFVEFQDDAVEIDGEHVGYFSGEEHDTCGTPLVDRVGDMFEPRGEKFYCFKCDVFVRQS
jgi:hypothetical protein